MGFVRRSLIASLLFTGIVALGALTLPAQAQTAKTGTTYLNLVAMRTADRDQAWVQDLADAYHSPEFLDVIDKHFGGFVKPDDLQALAATVGKLANAGQASK